jgi:hypothetical protein
MSFQRPPCVFCRRVRVFVGLAIIIVALLVARTDIVFLSDVNLDDLFFKFVVAMFLGVFIWKVYQEFWADKKDVKSEDD